MLVYSGTALEMPISPAKGRSGRMAAAAIDESSIRAIERDAGPGCFGNIRFVVIAADDIDARFRVDMILRHMTIAIAATTIITPTLAGFRPRPRWGRCHKAPPYQLYQRHAEIRARYAIDASLSRRRCGIAPWPARRRL